MIDDWKFLNREVHRLGAPPERAADLLVQQVAVLHGQRAREAVGVGHAALAVAILAVQVLGLRADPVLVVRHRGVERGPLLLEVDLAPEISL